jgi:hypothetical protein
MVISVNRACILAASLAACAGVAHAGIDVIFSRANGATSVVPGAVDASGTPAVTNFFSMNEFFLSPDGTKWIMRGVTTQASSVNQVMLTGGGLTGSVLLQKTQPFPGAASGETVNFPSALSGYPFNANNDFAFGIRVSGNADSFMYKILHYTGVVGAVRAQSGDLYTSSVGSVHMGSQIDSIHLRNNGVIGWRDTNAPYGIAVYDEARYLQANSDTVTKIDGSGPIGLSAIMSTGDFGDFLTSLDGTLQFIRGRADVDGNHNPAGDPDVVVLNGRIIAQVGQPLPGESSITVQTLDQVSIAPNNDWYMRGTYSGGAWATKNGTLIAKTGDAVGANTWGSPFLYSGNMVSSFFAVGGNSHGDWVLVGRTTAGVDFDDVVVVNGQVVIREGDPVSLDIDGDGILDTAYIGRSLSSSFAFSFNTNTPVGLAPDKTVYILANLRTITGQDVVNPPANAAGTALLRITPVAPPACCLNDFNRDGDVGTDADIEDFFACLGGDCCANCPPNADFNCDGDVGTDADIESFFRVLAGGAC